MSAEGLKNIVFSRSEFISDAIVLAVIYGFLVSVFPPQLMLSKTITSGGDTASQYYPAKYLMEELLPRGRLSGWMPGWYAGIPLFENYFIPPFLLAAVLGHIISLQVAFKLVTVLGIFLFPLSAFLCLRFMGVPSPAPAFAAAFTLPILFQETYSMWGGNIPSTLAGEFSYSISLSLTVLFFGLIYWGLHSGRHWCANTLLLALIALTHVYTVLWAVVATPAFLVSRQKTELIKRIKYVLTSYPVAFLLCGFWIIPMLARIAYTTPYALRWYLDEDAFAPILWPLIVLAFAGAIYGLLRRDSRVMFFLWSCTCCALFYIIAPSIGLVDIRFMPFIFTVIGLLAAYGLGCIASKMRGRWALPIIIVLLTICWVNGARAIITSDSPIYGVDVVGEGVGFKIISKDYAFHSEQIIPRLTNWTYVGYIRYWVKWNYEGFESKVLWPQYMNVNEFLKADVSAPRVKFEHNEKHNGAGSVRAFESIPMFSGRSILEGLYIHASPTSPSVFYTQSEVSEQQSCPFWRTYRCTSFDLDDGTEHLKMFNTQYIVAVSEKLKGALSENPQWVKVLSEDPFEVWELTTNTGQYVTVPKNYPVVFPEKDWKTTSYLWFTNTSLIDTPLIFDDELRQLTTKYQVMSGAEELPLINKVPVEISCNVTEDFTAERISFTTDCVGLPHIISVSYHPSWAVDGADKIYLASPSFMLVYPTSDKVTLTYSRTWVDWAGILATLSAAAVISFGIWSSRRRGSP